MLSSNWLGHHPFTVEIYGFEPRLHDKALGYSAAASTPDFDSGGSGSSPGAPTKKMELWQMWYMRRTENPQNVVQFHEAPPKKNMASVAQMVRAPECGSGGRGFEALCPPQREYSSVVEQMAVNHRVVGSSPSIPASFGSMAERSKAAPC